MKALKWMALSWLLAAVAVAAEPKQPAFLTKEATGEAAIVEGNREKAERDARNAALREAVEQVAGVLVSSDTLTANSQLVSDRIYANSSGYVRKYEVLEKKEEGGVLRVTVRAEVGTAQLDKDLRAVRGLVQRLGNRKLLIVLQEQTVRPDKVVTSSGVLSQVLTEAFSQDGWRIIDPAFAAGKLEVASGVALGTPDKKVIQDLRAADYVIMGTVTFRQEPNDGLLKLQHWYPVTGEWEVAVFATDSGSQLARLSGKFATRDEEAGQESSPVVSYERTAFEIARFRGKHIVAQVRKAVVESLAQAEQNGNTVVMTVLGLQDYGAVQAFKKVLAESVSGMRDVRPGNFGAGKAQFDVVFVGSTDDLAEAVGGRAFKGRKISVTGVSGNTVELTLAK
jgi:hypothetical protein